MDRLLLDEADAALTGADVVAVVDDVSGLLACSAARRHPQLAVRVVCDSLLAEQAVRREAAELGLDDRLTVVDSVAAAVAGASVLLLRLPKSVAALDEIAAAAAGAAAGQLQLFAGGRVKHMTRAMNDVLAQHFGRVGASLGRQKSRVLRASDPRPVGEARWPQRRQHEDLGLVVCAHGAAFAGAGIDHGTRLLLSVLDEVPPSASRVIDVGCGTGVLACCLARARPRAQVLAIDESSAACRSATETAAANQLTERVTVLRADGLREVPSQSADLILCNPPFHRGTSRDSSTALQMIADAGRVLAPGGEMWTVFNSHLPYRGELRREVGPTEIVRQDPGYSVARTRRR
ncbi:methyltransferase [Microlunatus panaciterrae]